MVSDISLSAFTPAALPALIDLLNQLLAGHRHWAPITASDFALRVLSQPGFDPQGLILAWHGEQLVGGVHAIRPQPPSLAYRNVEPQHHIAWLVVHPQQRGQAVGNRLLTAAENYLYYCPVYFAGQAAPYYGVFELLWVPWYGSTERMGVSALHDGELIAWLGRRGYQVVNPGDVSMVASLHSCERPEDPGLAERGLDIVMINQASPWDGEEPAYRLRSWGRNAGREYQGLVVADGQRAVGSAVWYPLPDAETAALAWFGIERHYRGLRFGSYLLDRALSEMAARGYLYVEVHAHTKESAEAASMLRRRGFQTIDYWVNLVKT